MSPSPQPQTSPHHWQIMHPVRAQVHRAMCLAALAALAGTASLWMLAQVIQALSLAPARWPVWPLAGTLGCLLASYLLKLQAFNQSHYAAFRLETILRNQLARHLASLSLGQLQHHDSGTLSKIMQDDVKALHIFVADSTPLYARAFVAPLATLLLLLWLDWRLALAGIALLLLGAAVLTLAMRNAGSMGQHYNQARERVSSAIVEFVQAMPVVRTFDSGTETFSRYQQALKGYLAVITAWYRQAGIAARLSFAVLNPLPTLLVLLWCGYGLWQQDGLSFSQWAAVLLLGSGMAEAIMPMMMLNHMVSKARLSIERIQDLLRLPVMDAPEQGCAPADASVTVEQVSLDYLDRRVLHNVSFHLPAGSVTALVGPSGAGKSSIASLIPRFRDPQHGRILLGGVDIRTLSTDILMQQIAWVAQETFLFADTLLNNIRLGQPEKTREQVMDAARAAQAHDFIMQLEQGYDTHVGERGASLSGGQRQRIAIARALLQNRPILILDEATAFADAENEAALIAALSQLMQGKTVLMVAHRLSTIRDADQILVFEQGQLAEAGTHQTLLAKAGIYARMTQHYQQARDWAISDRSRTDEPL
ncbi:ABC transporter ATP-binding protein [Erwinia sp. MYb416]|uniref:ABC transporter ATP-binding protein n=1 Tax=Erwinia sp. MYb416 TaxID=3108532 RepID=UPI0030A0AE96